MRKSNNAKNWRDGRGGDLKKTKKKRLRCGHTHNTHWRTTIVRTCLNSLSSASLHACALLNNAASTGFQFAERGVAPIATTAESDFAVADRVAADIATVALIALDAAVVVVVVADESA